MTPRRCRRGAATGGVPTGWPPRRAEAAGSTVAAAAHTSLDLEELGHEVVVEETGSTVAAAAHTALDLEELGHEVVVEAARCRRSARRGGRRGRGREEAAVAVAGARPVLGRTNYFSSCPLPLGFAFSREKKSKLSL